MEVPRVSIVVSPATAEHVDLSSTLSNSYTGSRKYNESADHEHDEKNGMLQNTTNGTHKGNSQELRYHKGS